MINADRVIFPGRGEGSRFSIMARVTADIAVVAGAHAIWQREALRPGFLSPQSRRRRFVCNKKDGSPVTFGDSQTQRFIAMAVQAQKHKIGPTVLFGEEDMSGYGEVADMFVPLDRYEDVLKADQVLVADPINNTRDYIKRLPPWDVVLGWLERGRLRIGVHYSPEDRNLLCVSEIGVGAFISKGPGFKLGRVRPPKWNGKLSDLVVGHGYSIPRDARYRSLWDHLVGNGVETHEIVSTSAGLVSACEWCHVYIHGFTFGHDIVAGMVALLASNQSVQIFQDLRDGLGPQPLPELNPRVFNPHHSDLSTEICGGNPAAVDMFRGLWSRLVKDVKETVRSLKVAS